MNWEHLDETFGHPRWISGLCKRSGLSLNVNMIVSHKFCCNFVFVYLVDCSLSYNFSGTVAVVCQLSYFGLFWHGKIINSPYHCQYHNQINTSFNLHSFLSYYGSKIPKLMPADPPVHIAECVNWIDMETSRQTLQSTKPVQTSPQNQYGSLRRSKVRHLSNRCQQGANKERGGCQR